LKRELRGSSRVRRGESPGPPLGTVQVGVVLRKKTKKEPERSWGGGGGKAYLAESYVSQKGVKLQFGEKRKGNQRSLKNIGKEKNPI